MTTVISPVPSFSLTLLLTTYTVTTTHILYACVSSPVIATFYSMHEDYSLTLISVIFIIVTFVMGPSIILFNTKHCYHPHIFPLIVQQTFSSSQSISYYIRKKYTL